MVTRFGKAVAKITDDLDELLTFYDYPSSSNDPADQEVISKPRDLGQPAKARPVCRSAGTSGSGSAA
ncbi:MAG TPA: hypothetical protein VFO16_22985 [Pseudonocardiaceae bacterium]|nr:hypothetical protein [Pseudonocardiaceae bacterium]